MMRRLALPPAPPMSRAERQRLHRTLLEQSDLLRRGASLDDCDDLRELVDAARHTAGRAMIWRGLQFSVRRGAVFSEVRTRQGRRLAAFGGAIFG